MTASTVLKRACTASREYITSAPRMTWAVPTRCWGTGSDQSRRETEVWAVVGEDERVGREEEGC